MTHRQHGIDQLIEDVTVDCYNEDEERSSFIVAFDHHLTPAPIAATVVGVDVEMTGVSDGGGRRGLVAHLRQPDRTDTVALCDIALGGDADPDLALLLETYRAWCER